MIIAALSTPRGRGAINVIRLSGAGCKELAQQMFSPFPDKPNFLRLGKLTADAFSDTAMCVFFNAPHSYTGEDSVEFHCHGGEAVAAAVLKKCFSLGAQPALNGEFSKRAFLNGKQNLSNAEGVIDLIDAESDGAARAGVMLMENRLGERISQLKDALTDALAGIEAALDYPEEDLEGQTAAEQTITLTEVKRKTDELLQTVRLGGLVKNGIFVAIVGATNAGKSSLLNALAGEERAIVSDIHGTTRDTVDISVLWKDAKLTFEDTAGLRNTDDEIEKIGIQRTMKAAKKAAAVLYLREGHLPHSEINRQNEQLNTDCPVLNVFTKADVNAYDESLFGPTEIAVSAKTGYNVDVLKDKVLGLFFDKTENGLIITNLRHADCLRRASQSLDSALNGFADGTSMDCVAADVKQAWIALGEVTGDTADAEIVDRIFSRFCLGK